MRCRLLTAATLAVMMLLGPLAATAFAQPYPPDAEVDAEVEEIVEVAPQVIVADAVQPAEVLGVSLAVTGANTLILALFGALLVGLGFLAVRRPKRVDDGT